jgi:hypothetical protein
VSVGPISAARRHPPRQRRRWPRIAAIVAAAMLLFAVGVALGLALDDRPVPGGTQTVVRTLEPLPQQPAP